MVVKITHSSFEVVFQIIKHTMIYPSSDTLLQGNSPVSRGLILKMNRGYNGGEQRAREVHVVKGEMITYALPEG
jgi:hypothetical protein